MKNPCDAIGKRWTLLGAALLFAAGAAGAAAREGPRGEEPVGEKPVWYSGEGYVGPLSAPGPGGRVAFGLFNPGARLDLVQWDPDGALHLHDAFAEYDDRTVIGVLEAFAVTRHGGDRI